ncbi:MAG: helix-turn-helix domain-containing GNAT family N-acetyltransferase [Sphingomonas sp.]
MELPIDAVRAFSRFYTRFSGALDGRFLGSDMPLVAVRLLYEIAHRDGPVASDLQRDLGLDAGYVSRVLRDFEKRGWIARDRGSDARRRPIRMTSSGRAAFDEIDLKQRNVVAEQLAPLGENDRLTLIDALATARSLLDRHQDSGWSLRTFRPGDMGMIAARQAILYNETQGWGTPLEAMLGELGAGFLRDFRPGREQCWIAERGGRMLGSIMLCDDGDGWARLRLLYVEPDAHRLGIGGALVQRCVDFAREAGYHGIRLWTHAVLEGARRRYAAAGFKMVERESHMKFGVPVDSEHWEMAFDGPTISPVQDAADLAAVKALFADYAASLSIDLEYQHFAEELAGLPGDYAAPRGALFLARDIDATPLGCVALRPAACAGDAEMKRLYVAPAARGTKLGLRLAEAMIAEAARLGYRAICLDTLPEMTAAQGLYRALGFLPAAPYYTTPVAGTVFLRRAID